MIKSTLFLISIAFTFAFTFGFCSANAQNSSTLIIENASYLDLKEGAFLTGNITIENGLIKSIDKENAQIKEARRIDGAGKFIIPGLIDSHIHLFQSGGIYTRPDAVDLRKYKPYEKERKFLRDNAGDLLKRYLRCGITSVVDIGGPLYQFEIRDQFKDDPNYPNLFLTGPLITTFDVPVWEMEESPIIRVHTEEEARQLVQDQIPFNPDFIKIWGMPLPTTESTEDYDLMMAAIDEAKKNNFRVFVHATRLNGAKLAVKAGADVLVHGVSGWSDIEFSEMLRDSNVVLIPTMVVSGNYSRTFAQDFKPTKEDFEISNPFILGEIFDTEHLTEEAYWQQSIKNYPQIKKTLEIADSNNMVNIELMKRYGNTIATGTDAGNIGTLHASSYYDEISAMKQAGMSNFEVVRASTINGAKTVGKADKIGSIEVGKMADLVILKNNPLIDLENLKSIHTIIKSGMVHDPSEILPIGPEILAQQQLNAYNAGDIDAFMAPYSEDIEIYNFPDELRSKGKEAMRPGYEGMFANTPNLHCELVNRMVLGNTVIDHERITGIPDRPPFEAIAIYKIENNKIAKVYFAR